MPKIVINNRFYNHTADRCILKAIIANPRKLVSRICYLSKDFQLIFHRKLKKKGFCDVADLRYNVTDTIVKLQTNYVLDLQF